jgi:selenocysteine-specific elongation factor
LTEKTTGAGPNERRHLIIGTAGHVDHGKTTLIRALTGIETDRLAEEKARGMTIDLGFAFLDLPGDPPVAAGIVDVPGHERFVKNMLSGTGGIDLALLVVAADEGPMPQTREHLDILTVLGIERGVVALTKIDRVDDELAEIAARTTRDALSGTPLRDAVIVPVSAVSGAGIPELLAALARAAATIPPRLESAPFRLPVDRVFSLHGVGTIATGTLLTGTLRTGDAIQVQPQNLTTRARTLQTHDQRIDAATPGMRVAVNLPGIDVSQIERGAVLAPPGAVVATTLFDARLMLLPDAPRPLRHRERVRLHLGTGEVLARVLLLRGTAIDPGESGIPAQLQCEGLVAPARGERFVLRTYSPARAVGGGVVMDPQPPRRYRRGDETALARFVARAETGNTMEIVYAALTARHADLTPDEIAISVGVELPAVDEALAELVEAGRAAALPDGRYVSDVAVRRLEETARRALSTYHRQNPLRKAMPREGLRAPLAKAAEVHDYAGVMIFLSARGVIVADAASVRLPEHEVTIPVGWQKPSDEILAVYAGAALQPPSPDNFQAHYPRDINVKSILNILTENGHLVRIGDDLFIHVDAYASVRAALVRLAETPDGITVGAVRDATGSSRKIILPLLEFLDAQRITQRVGEKRILLAP